MCLGEAPMTLQERPGISRKLTTTETLLQTTVMQPMGEDMGSSVDWLIPQVRNCCKNVHQLRTRMFGELCTACLPIGQPVLRMNQ